MRIKVQGDNVQTWLNGQEMVNINDEKIGAGQGRIALQIHDGGGIKVLWRNLKNKNIINSYSIQMTPVSNHMRRESFFHPLRPCPLRGDWERCFSRYCLY